jgi:hypothetical protein
VEVAVVVALLYRSRAMLTQQPILLILGLGTLAILYWLVTRAHYTFGTAQTGLIWALYKALEDITVVVDSRAMQDQRAIRV